MARFKYIYGEHEDVVIGKEQIACIVCNPDGNSWRLIRLEENAGIKVNGEELHLVHYLSAGDRIDLEGETETLQFAIRKNTSNEDIRQLRRTISRIGIFAAATSAVALVIIFFTFSGHEDRVTRKDVSQYEESVCKISVVKAIYQQVTITKNGIHTETLDERFLDNLSGSGTGFFCNDGRFVTARHCVEPWITESDPLGAYDNPMVRWAIESETFNASEHSSDSLFRRVITYCEVYNKDALKHCFSTDTCCFSTENDLVRNLRGRLDPLYWRELGNISRPGSLGDIVAIQTPHKGKITVASKDMMMGLKAERQVAHLGYEKTQTNLNFETSRLKYDPIRNDSEIIRCLEHISIEMVQGFSGSPALIKENGKFYAVGVVSKTKDSSTSTFFSVPITELDKTQIRWKD